MATLQARLLTASSFSSVAPLSGACVSTFTNVQCKAWSRTSARRSLSIRATTGPSPPSSPPGLSGSEIPLGGGVSTAPIEQKGVPKGERIAYSCTDCGYIYDLDIPFEEQPDESYNCPVCKAPKDRFTPTNATLGEGVFDVTKDKDASS